MKADHLLVTADERMARIYSCHRTREGRLRLEQVASLENSHEGEHQRERPDMLAAPSRQRGVRGDGAHGSPHFTSLGHGEDEERRRFAREITAWLGSRDCGRVSVFAPPRMLGLLRRHVKPPVVDARLRAGELTKLTEHELAAHPAVREVFGV